MRKLNMFDENVKCKAWFSHRHELILMRSTSICPVKPRTKQNSGDSANI